MVQSLPRTFLALGVGKTATKCEGDELAVVKRDQLHNVRGDEMSTRRDEMAQSDRVRGLRRLWNREEGGRVDRLRTQAEVVRPGVLASRRLDGGGGGACCR